jgi:hypothetical protein
VELPDIRLGRLLGAITYQNRLPATQGKQLLTACLSVANTLGFSKREEHIYPSKYVFFTEIYIKEQHHENPFR